MKTFQVMVYRLGKSGEIEHWPEAEFSDRYKALVNEGLPAGEGPHGVDFGTLGRGANGRILSFICNEWGMVIPLPANRHHTGPWHIYGNFVVFAADQEGETVSLSDDEIAWLEQYWPSYLVSKEA